MPFIAAVVASLTLHLAVLLSPGWELPLDNDEEGTVIDATLTIPRPPAAAPAPKKLPKPAEKRPSKPASPASPVADNKMAIPAAGDAVAQPAAGPVAEVAPEPVLEPVVEEPVAVPPAPTFAHAEIWPRSGRIVFQVTRGEGGFIVGQAEHAWRHDGRVYELRAVTETTGLAAMFKQASVKQESRGSFSAAGLQPDEFVAERDGKLKDSLHFDYASGQLKFTNGNRAVFPVGTQDLLTLFYQLGAYALDAGPFVIDVSSGRRISRFLVSIGETSSLDTPRGPRSVRHLKVTGTAREDATEVWLDTETRLPLKIRHRDRKGEVFDQIATAIELDHTP